MSLDLSKVGRHLQPFLSFVSPKKPNTSSDMGDIRRNPSVSSQQRMFLGKPRNFHSRLETFRFRRMSPMSVTFSIGLSISPRIDTRDDRLQYVTLSKAQLLNISVIYVTLLKK